MNKFRIILKPVQWPANGRTNQHFNLEQTMAFRINTMEGWNLIHQFLEIGIRSCPQSHSICLAMQNISYERKIHHCLVL